MRSFVVDMAGSLRKFFESLVYAGLKPSGGKAAAPPKAQGFWDRLLAGPSPADPLYLSNRTWKQKLRTALLVAVPVLVVVGAATYAMLRPPTLPEKRPESLTPAEIAARTPILPENFTVQQNTDLQVVEVGIVRENGAQTISGTLKNNSRRRWAGADLSFDLADQEGSQVGGASTHVGTIEPRATVPFRFSIPHKNAAFVLVREIRPSY